MSDRLVSSSPATRAKVHFVAVVFAALPLACGGASDATNLGSGASPSTGGQAAGGAPNGGTSSGGATATGGLPSGGSNNATGGSATTGGSGNPTGGAGGTTATPDGLIGWASVSGMNVATTTGGGSLDPVDVSDPAVLQVDLNGSKPGVVRLTKSVKGVVDIGSNKTLIGAPGVVFTGHLGLDGSVNVIIKNLTIVGYNCSDSPADCSAGYDAVTVINGAHHIWIDHCDVSDGSDGNLDITQRTDFVTVSWTKFHYSGNRSGGHQFSNLVGASDTETADTDHLNVTWHHDWWADHANQRMPRVRYGKNHVFNSLYTSSGNSYCVGVGVNSNILTENNVFDSVHNPIDSTDYSNAASVVVSRGNQYNNTSGSTANKGTAVFKPPYPYTLDDVGGVENAVRSGAGPQ